MMEFLPRPLDPLRSIKVKLGVTLVGAGAAGIAVFSYGMGFFPPKTALTAIVVALVTSQALANGMTAPLREMTAAARAMARGDYSRRVRATSRDEVGQLAAAFNQMAADLASADQQRRELIANVSHELRTPISALRAVLENIVDGVAAPDPATLRTALAQTERLGRLITELLDLSRIDAGVLALDLEEFAVADLFADVVAEAEVAAGARDRKIGFRIEVVPADLTVHADRERLHQVVVNLLDNAVRHGPADGTVTVRGFAEPAGVVIEVADEGPGIPAEERERVFERFTRGGRSTGGGTGLGLAIARWMVELHHGGISVADAEDPPGCRIRVTLPGPDST
ncbi:HAMP domain-containing sensor histidine kinase [Planosporangium mesophilum]|uniref:histidine kinase n=1 Tax=Planosporangium mesophilum TaxID=689768 RepID=A0A8J3X5N7_9ACTN|nr:ATP-binding protein [Planosporangium mesophilum]NJC82325.1 HAMP domain-containing protein [Planosporangium mesophilum]GII24933.1 two-component sensor histidine kinase [Planosporangium mesophilum]